MAGMTRTLKIDFVSDIVCPWCAVGLGGLDRALEALKGDVEADITFRPFELNPQMAPEGENIVEHIGRKYGSTPEQSRKNRAMIAERGAAVGFTFAYTDDSRIWNTFDAHRLLHWAELEGKQPALKRALLETYFTEQKSPADHDILVAVAESVGLDGVRAREVLSSGEYAEVVREQEAYVQRLGISAVPSVIIEGKYLIQGGQPAAVYEDALRRIAAEAA